MAADQVCPSLMTAGKPTPIAESGSAVSSRDCSSATIVSTTGMTVSGVAGFGVSMR
ncbi:Uncharacterised protein [Rothia kristinae]|nr:Uncharacterised protein [Rothia kristinae]